MNKEIIGSVVRHSLTVVSGIVLANNTTSLQTALPDLINSIAKGDLTTICSSAIMVGSLLWSMWLKVSLETKSNIKVKLATIGKTVNVTPLSNNPTIVVYGNIKSCGYCKAFWSIVGNSNTVASFENLTKFISNANFVNADTNTDPTTYAYWRKKFPTFKYFPTIAVFGANGALLGNFTGRSTYINPFTIETIVNKIKTICPECEAGTTPPPVTPPVTPPVVSGCKCVKCNTIDAYCSVCGTKR